MSHAIMHAMQPMQKLLKRWAQVSLGGPDVAKMG